MLGKAQGFDFVAKARIPYETKEAWREAGGPRDGVRHGVRHVVRRGVRHDEACREAWCGMV